jgi:hypothetical protein
MDTKNLKCKVFNFRLDYSNDTTKIINKEINKWLKKNDNCEIEKIEKMLFDQEGLLVFIYYKNLNIINQKENSLK